MAGGARLASPRVADDDHRCYLEHTRRAAVGLDGNSTPTMAFYHDVTPPHHGSDDPFSFLDA